MTIVSLLVWIAVGVLAGFLAGKIVKGYGFGLIGNLVIGAVGAVLAGFILPMLGVGFSLGNEIVTQIAYATIGAIVLLFLIGLVRRAA